MRGINERLAITLVLALVVLATTACGDTPTYPVLYDESRVSTMPIEYVRDFLAIDKTNEHPYTTDNYTCLQFSSDLWWNAYTHGILGCIVIVYEDYHTHAIVKLSTDEGWLWVEPHLEFTSWNCWYDIQRTYCGQDAFDFCAGILNKLGRFEV